MRDEQDPEFDKTIGQLDFILSKLMIYSKDAANAELSEPNRQTLKHHAEDMIAAGKKILERLGINQEEIPQPEHIQRTITLEEFMRRTGCTDVGARPYLETMNWDLEKALDYYRKSD